MSWLYSRVLVEEYLGGNSSDGEPYAPLSVMLTPQQFWRNDKMMDCSKSSLFGLTLKHLTEDRGEELLMLFLEDFRARTSAQQDEAQESAESDQDSGVKWHGSFAKYDRDTHSWRTHQYSLLGDLTLYSETWPRWGLMRDGECWGQSMPAHLTVEKGSGYSLPTPSATQGMCGGEGARNKLKKLVEDGILSESEAEAEAMAMRKLWPTPTTQDNPQVRGEGKAAKHNKRGTTLGGAARQWPTPIARDSRTIAGGARAVNSIGSEPLISQVAEAENKTTGRLNPEWVEWLMGWPTGWTGLKPLEMDKFRQWLQWHSRY